MPIDPYSPCPGGTGKKIKFCCQDLVAELDKIQRMLEGDQPAGCLEFIESIEAKAPDRACLLSIKAMLQAQLEQPEKAEATLATFMQKYPDNPVALAEKATLLAGDDPIAAISPLQDALEKCGQEIAPQIYDAIGVVAQTLIAAQELFAGRGHLALQLGISGTGDQSPLQLLVRLNASPSIPLLAKQDLPLLPPPDDALWKSSFNEALEPSMRGAWRLAADKLAALAAKAGDWPSICHNIAVLRTWLADPRAIEAWRKYASQPIPLDDAVEAEALAQSLDPEAVEEIDVVTLDFQVLDSEALHAHLMANPRSLTMPIDLSRLGTENEPPPRGAYWLLDRALPEGEAATIAREQIPRVVGHVFLFGKQTDRPARLELTAYRSELEDAKRAAAEIGADSLGAAGEEKVQTGVPAVQHLLSFNWRLPDGTPPEKRLELVNQERREVLLNRWPAIPQKIFGGKSAAQVASEPAMRIRLLAAILLLEASVDPLTSDFDFNELRAKLALPLAEPIDPRTQPPDRLPLVRLGRVDVKQLSDDQLVRFYLRADAYRHIVALRKAAHEILARPSLEGAKIGRERELHRSEVLGLLAQIEPDTAKAIDYLNKAREAAETGKVSTAPWDLAELGLRIARGEVTEADRLLQHIRSEHIREPGVAQALMQILVDAGIIGPDGRPTAAAAGAPRARHPASSCQAPRRPRQARSGRPAARSPAERRSRACGRPAIERNRSNVKEWPMVCHWQSRQSQWHAGAGEVMGCDTARLRHD